MDEEKKQYLEELKKQIDPEILSKMAGHLGEGGSVPSGSGAGGGGGSTLGRTMQDQRSMRIQQRIAQRKKKMEMEAFAGKGMQDTTERNILVLSHNDIWSRIAVSQFKVFGYSSAEVFHDFESMIRRLFAWRTEESESVFSIAISLQMISSFVPSWQKLNQHIAKNEQHDFLKDIHYFLTVESMKQMPEKVLDIIGAGRVICLTDEPEENRRKIDEFIRGGSVDIDVSHEDQRGEK